MYILIYWCINSKTSFFNHFHSVHRISCEIGFLKSGTHFLSISQNVDWELSGFGRNPGVFSETHCAWYVCVCTAWVDSAISWTHCDSACSVFSKMLLWCPLPDPVYWGPQSSPSCSECWLLKAHRCPHFWEGCPGLKRGATSLRKLVGGGHSQWLIGKWYKMLAPQPQEGTILWVVKAPEPSPTVQVLGVLSCPLHLLSSKPSGDPERTWFS